MRATQPGPMLGRAIQSLPEDATVTSILVAINPQFASPEASTQLPLSPGAALDTLRSGFIVATSGAAGFSFRYVLAVATLLIALIFSLLIFSRSATNSVTAVGRNPLAQKSILAIAGINAGISVAIIVTGLILSFLILAL